jgi:hypothetical protein
MGRRSRRKLLLAAKAVHKSTNFRTPFDVQQVEWVAGGVCYVVDTTAKNSEFLHPYPFILVFIL